MTRENAIRELKIFSGTTGIRFSANFWEALNTAIKALDWYDVPSDEMTLEQARQAVKDLRKKLAEYLEQEPREMTAEEYRQRMIQAFHNADTDELIVVAVLPTEKEFEHLEWLLKNHYKKESCNDAISRQAVLEVLKDKWNMFSDANDAMQESIDTIEALRPVTAEPKTGHWIYDNFNWRCSECNKTPKTMGYVGTADFMTEHFKFCNHCGARMIEPQESEVEDGNVD